jgi:hypothetical protein
VGTITRGTTNPNRLRRVDRWLAGPEAWRLRRAGPAPWVVDLGYGASPVTAVELHDRLTRVRRDVQVVGIEIDPERVAAAHPLERPGLTFRLGGFEVPLDSGAEPVLVRAFNVLRQYDESAVPGAWRTMTSALAPGGWLIEGTCDELGRLACWAALPAGATAPDTLTLAARLADLEAPAALATRLPKALIHRNVPGEPVHALLGALDDAWRLSAALAPFGARQRWIAAVGRLRAAGYPVLDTARRWRLGEVTVRWPG